jgi:acyl-CoA reductase-like NAD-dependent aldehyde dehydrogenase
LARASRGISQAVAKKLRFIRRVETPIGSVPSISTTAAKRRIDTARRGRSSWPKVSIRHRQKIPRNAHKIFAALFAVPLVAALLAKTFTTEFVIKANATH